MKIYSKENVFNAALNRIRYLYDEFEEIIVGFSAGKDSVATLEMALIVAKEKKRLPLKVLFIDQEAEWQGTIDLVKETMYRKDIEPLWYQMPMVISNNASSTERFSYCWNEEEKDLWIHEKDPISIKENTYGTDRFHELFGEIIKQDYKDKKACYLSGVRTEEAPKRHVALTHASTYKWITWGKKFTDSHYTFYPLYDWSYTDIWCAIHKNNWSYNKVYDEMYRHGVKIKDMRISNVHHETALNALTLIQEIEPELWEKVSRRVNGANTIKHIEHNSYCCPKDLPYMFESWEEYALFLKDNMVDREKNRIELQNLINAELKIYTNDEIKDYFFRKVIDTILSNDWDFTKIANWRISQKVYAYRQFKRGIYRKAMLKYCGYLNGAQLEILINNIEKNELQKSD